MHTRDGIMANQQGNGRSTGRDDEDRYRSRDDDERGYGSHWEDRGDRDERWAGRTNSSAWGSERFGQREYGRGGWSQQGYGYNDSDRPSFERGMAGARTQEPATWERSGRNGLYGGGGYEPAPGGSRQQNRYGSQGYDSSGFRQHHGDVGQRFEQRRGPHRGKGPQGFVRSDERVRELVCEALTDDDEVDASHIEVSVKNGEVMLAGTVDDREQKRLAEDCVERVRGVRDVHNQLRIRS